VLTNTYVSHVISELNAPLKVEKLGDLNDLYRDLSNGTQREVLELYDPDMMFYLRDLSVVFSIAMK